MFCTEMYTFLHIEFTFHRITWWLGLEGFLWTPSGSNPLPKQGHLEKVVQENISTNKLIQNKTFL